MLAGSGPPPGLSGFGLLASPLGEDVLMPALESGPWGDVADGAVGAALCRVSPASEQATPKTNTEMRGGKESALMVVAGIISRRPSQSGGVYTG